MLSCYRCSLHFVASSQDVIVVAAAVAVAISAAANANQLLLKIVEHITIYTYEFTIYSFDNFLKEIII